MRTTEHYLKTLAAPVVVVAAGLLAASAAPSHAATTFTVNSTLDVGDTSPDGLCDSNLRPVVIRCTLREVIQEANANSGADTINFAIRPADTVHAISPTSELPSITEAVTIDGYTQPGASENTATNGTNAVLLIELNGAKGSFSALFDAPTRVPRVPRRRALSSGLPQRSVRDRHR